jgi:O-antigen/teichoic acid export membrane protein
MFFGLGVVALVNYLYQFFLGTYYLSVEEYGVFNALLSFSFLLLVPINALGQQFVKEKKSRDINSFFALSVLYSLIVFFVLVLFHSYLKTRLQIESDIVFWAFKTYAFLILISSLFRYFYQGQERYLSFSINIISQDLLKFGLLFVLYFLSVSSDYLYFSIAFSAFIIIIYNYFALKINIFDTHIFKLLTTLKGSLAILLLQICLMGFVTIDVLINKALFDPTSAGIYGAAVTIGKIIMFGSTILTLVAFPLLANSKDNKISYLTTFLTFLSVQIFCICSGVFIFWLFPHEFINIIFDEKFLVAGEILPFYGIFIGLFSSINFSVNVLISINKFSLMLFVLPVVLLGQTLILSMFFNYDLISFITLNIYLMAGLLVIVLFDLLASLKNL